MSCECLANVLHTVLVAGKGFETNALLAVPKYVFWVENYPKTASGKIQKFKLKEEGMMLVGEGRGLQ